jgi:hypothetical protein
MIVVSYTAPDVLCCTFLILCMLRACVELVMFFYQS